MKAGRMRRRIGRTPAEQPVEPAGEIVPWRKDPVAGYHAGGYLAHQLMQSERQDLSIYRAMGLPCTALRRSFSLRFLLVSLVGSDRLARCGHGPDRSGADADVWHEQL